MKRIYYAWFISLVCAIALSGCVDVTPANSLPSCNFNNYPYLWPGGTERNYTGHTCLAAEVADEWAKRKNPDWKDRKMVLDSWHADSVARYNDLRRRGDCPCNKYVGPKDRMPWE